ncbi:hypothetical protein ACFQU7_18275 [Pseudoroseomonas wenyumeiae]
MDDAALAAPVFAALTEAGFTPWPSGWMGRWRRSRWKAAASPASRRWRRGCCAPSSRCCRHR